jgi:hypothetical protein
VDQSTLAFTPYSLLPVLTNIYRWRKAPFVSKVVTSSSSYTYALSHPHPISPL